MSKKKHHDESSKREPGIFGSKDSPETGGDGEGSAVAGESLEPGEGVPPELVVNEDQIVGDGGEAAGSETVVTGYEGGDPGAPGGETVDMEPVTTPVGVVRVGKDVPPEGDKGKFERLQVDALNPMAVPEGRQCTVVLHGKNRRCALKGPHGIHDFTGEKVKG